MTSKVFRDTTARFRTNRGYSDVTPVNSNKYTEECTTTSEVNALSENSMDVVIPRTPLLILDYVHFLAARVIQRKWRSYARRAEKKSLNRAAITIQRWWRGYWVRSRFTLFVEQKLQSTLVEYYNKAATKIQALFRGYLIRLKVHNVHALKKMQTCAAQELLNCVAFKLHHLLRTYSIPGVYSLRESHCLSRVEKLLNSLRFRFHNGRVNKFMINHEELIKSERKKFNYNRLYTGVPFKGPNDKRACNPQCEEFLNKTSDLDNRMYKIIAEYDKSQRDDRSRKTQYNLAERKRRRHIQLILEQRDRHHCNFCADVVASMCRWKVWDDQNLIIDRDVFRNPGNLEQFLNEASEIMDNVQGRCHCKITLHDVVQCH